MRHDDLALFGLTEKDIPRLSPKGIRELIARADRMLKVWSLTSQDRKKYTYEREALQRILSEIDPKD